uniref:C-type lectin domain family 4 member A-like mRNA variant X2.2 n=1 Tax=Sus scrofa domesticus TaxID=9825 RepID=A0A5K0UBV1_PIG|nr:C-type lectin domain family 4 member A-like mRNA variant X2.2 [Sus scrofa domesticus]VDJ10597.1 C-type lectin domain family 4 member A-like mRNA variant X2.4 [Sus scrofa domesticus]
MVFSPLPLLSTAFARMWCEYLKENMDESLWTHYNGGIVSSFNADFSAIDLEKSMV